MDFSTIPLGEEDAAFVAEVSAFFNEHVTAEVHELERRTGAGFNEGVHLALAARGWVTPTWSRSEGGADLDPLKLRLFEAELDRSGLPISLAATTDLPVLAVRAFGDPELRDEIISGVAEGRIRICLGYTEPDCGSDLAGVRTRASREGDHWIINGQKMFTTGAQDSQYCFALTRTDPSAPKHKGLTTFLIPLDIDGVEITPIRTIGGERTNFVHFDDVRIPDRFRLGEIGGGWAVMAAPLAAEHGRGDHGAGRPIGTGTRSFALPARAAVSALREALIQGLDGPLLTDATARVRLARIELAVEVCLAAPGNMGRILSSDLVAAAMSDLLELSGPAGVLGHGARGAVAGAAAETGFRYAPGTAIYGGTTEVHRNLLAEQVLGLPRSTPRG